MAKSYKLHPLPQPVASSIPWHERLNDEQYAVVAAPASTQLVIAGAGSGKTRTLIYRVAWLLEQGAPLDSLVLLTFTNRAAREMSERVSDLLKIDTRTMWAGTFHSVCRRILRDHATRLGFPENFSVIDREDSESLMKAVIADLPSNPNTSSTRFPRADTVLNILSDALNRGRVVDDIVRERFPQFSEHTERIDEAMRRYSARKAEYGVMDFDDLLFLCHRLLIDHEDIRQGYARQFRHVLVDEYQDTNTVQAALVDLLVQHHRSLMVVGDDCQSIYSFRGADFQNIIGFRDRYPQCEVKLLSRNYRSSPQIVALANTSIRHNRVQYDKELVSQQADGHLPALIPCPNEGVQSAFVAQRILEIRDEGVELQKICVLYRAHWQSMELQLALGKARIPFVIRSGVRFFEQRHIKDVLAFLRFVENPRDELSFARIATLAEGVGAGTAGKLFMYLRAHDDWTSALRSPDVARIAGKRGAAGAQQLAQVLERIARPDMRSNAAATIDYVRQSLYDDHARRVFENAPNRLRELETMSEYAAQKGPVSDFLDDLALAGAVSGQDVTATGDPDEHVVLSSIHQAKGLEFEVVFVLWLTEDRFPSSRALESAEELEEERRLFYVAVTRAQRQLYLMQPLMGIDRFNGMVALRQSRFISEVANPVWDPPLLEVWNLT